MPSEELLPRPAISEAPAENKNGDGDGVLGALRAVAGNHDHDAAVKAVLERFGREVGARAALAAVTDGNPGRLAVRAAWAADSAEVQTFALSVDEAMLFRMFGEAEPRFEQLDRHPIWEWEAQERNGGWGLAVPIGVGNGSTGGLFAAFDGEPEQPSRTVARASRYAPLAEVCLRHSVEVERLETLARFDPLTGCFNRVTILELLGSEVARSERRGHPLSLCFLDLDGFKAVNDVHGHLAGDRVLGNVGAALRVATREYDLVGRVGGDEFIVVMPETAKGKASRTAGRLVTAVGDATAAGPQGPVNISFGIAERNSSKSTTDLLAAADRELLRMKANSREGSESR